MPQLSEIVKSRKKFKKVEYRAWDIAGEWIEENKQSSQATSANNPVEVMVEEISSTAKAKKKAISLEKNLAINEPKNTYHSQANMFVEHIPAESPSGKHKKDLNSTQIDHKIISKKELIDAEMDHKSTLNRSHQIIQNLKITEIDHKENTEQITDQVLKRYQTDHKIGTDFELCTVVGKERELLFFIFSSCIKNRSTVSEPLTLEQICRHTTLRITTVKTTINRLVTKNLIVRSKGKKGRSGWMRFGLPDVIYNEILIAEKESKWGVNRSQIGLKQVSEQVTEQITTPLSSSSLINNTTTTTNLAEPAFLLDNSWALIDFTSLMEIGFGEPQLAQLAKAGKLTPEQVQDSIHAFAFARKQPEIAKSIRSEHLNYFMGILNKKGEPYLPPINYESPKELALKAEIERRKRRVELESELRELEFQEWYIKLTIEEKNVILEQELTSEQKESFFGSEARYMPEHVKENKRKEVLKPYFFNVIITTDRN